MTQFLSPNYKMFFDKWAGGVVVSIVASQQQSFWFESQLGPFCGEFACSPGYSGFLPPS